MKPLLFRWDGEHMEPLQRHRALADKQYVVGETYTLVPEEQRSIASHRQYFAAIHEAWMNLPEDVAEQWPTSEHLRKWALVKAGYCDERTIVCASKAQAHEIAATIRPLDEYALILPFDNIIKIWTAKSQSFRSMPKGEFQQSKERVLEIVSAMVGVKPRELEEAAA